jgi:hypothetical protein
MKQVPHFLIENWTMYVHVQFLCRALDRGQGVFLQTKTKKIGGGNDQPDAFYPTYYARI